jgi:hypothetical protein
LSDPPIELDKHRGMAAQKATDIRRVEPFAGLPSADTTK